MDRITIGKKLRDLRGDKTLEEVSKDINVTRQALSTYERGTRTPRDEVKIKLAAYYGLSVGELFFSQVS